VEPGLPSTEGRGRVALDLLDARGVVDALQAQDLRAVEAARAARDDVARLVELARDALGGPGRLVLVGAGTSGRLAALEAAECPPTFSTDPSKVIALLAGGDGALMKAVEGAEDDREAGARAVDEARAGAHDLVVGVTASGRTVFVLGALERARARGARTAIVACDAAARAAADHAVILDTGPEALSGSTRLKAGTATKIVLNAITTGAMALLGKVYGDLMVDVAPTNEKLVARATRIVAEIAVVDDATARGFLDRAGREPKTAIVMARLGLDAAAARERLARVNGSLRRALGEK
jgi:N-acetylmuramic acid 6-phosphate etherase